MNTYHIATDAGFRLTVFAESEAEAVTFFCIHHEIIMGLMPTDFEVGVIESMRTPIEQNCLDEARDSGIFGVGYYLPGHGWKIMPPDVTMRLEVNRSAWDEIAELKDRAPTRLYRFFGRKKEMFVFARHLAEATNIITAWRERHAALWKKAAIDPLWGEALEGLEAEHLREALERRQSGVGEYDPRDGWTITPWPGLRAV